MLPDEPEDVMIVHGRPIGSTLTVSELSRTPLQLVWAIEQDAFARKSQIRIKYICFANGVQGYIVHCCARYHNVVSFSASFLSPS